MLNRRRLLGGFAAGSALSLLPGRLRSQPPVDRSADPVLAYLAHGPDEERARLDLVEDRLAGFGHRYGFRLQPVDDERLADGDLDDFAGFAVYAAGLPVRGESTGEPLVRREALRSVIRAVRRGAGLLALHDAAGLWPSSGALARNQADRSPWVETLGAERIASLPAAGGVLRMADRSVPGMSQLDESIALEERWLAFKNFDPGMHVVMIQDTSELEGDLYRRPSYPATWLRYHRKGRVFYTSLGYARDLWEGEVVRRCVVGGALWILRDTEADVSANLMRVAPMAIQASYPT